MIDKEVCGVVDSQDGSFLFLGEIIYKSKNSEGKTIMLVEETDENINKSSENQVS